MRVVMNWILKYALLAFLLVNAVFWGLAPHAIHCKVSGYLFMGLPCIPHWIHQSIGAACMILLIVLFFML